MQSAREFMEAYLREQDTYIQWHRQHHGAFGEKFYSKERLDIPWIGYRFPAFKELLLTVETSGETSLAFTEDARTRTKWHRYHLRVYLGEWEIYNYDGFCQRCNGTGRYLSRMQYRQGHWAAHNMVESCQICDGTGWRTNCRFLTREEEAQ